MKRITTLAFIALPLTAACLLAGCGGASSDDAPGSASASEAQALEEAAEMIEAQRLPPEAMNQSRDPAPGKEQPAP